MFCKISHFTEKEAEVIRWFCGSVNMNTIRGKACQMLQKKYKTEWKVK